MAKVDQYQNNQITRDTIHVYSSWFPMTLPQPYDSLLNIYELYIHRTSSIEGVLQNGSGELFFRVFFLV